jgi:hypothetical protein
MKKKQQPMWERPDLKPMNLKKIATRPRSLDILEYPSRIENTYFYPDGRIVRNPNAQ